MASFLNVNEEEAVDDITHSQSSEIISEIDEFLKVFPLL